MLARLLKVRSVACSLRLNIEELKRRMKVANPPARTPPTVHASAEVEAPGAITLKIGDLLDIVFTLPSAPAVCARVAESEVSTECEARQRPFLMGAEIRR